MPRRGYRCLSEVGLGVCLIRVSGVGEEALSQRSFPINSKVSLKSHILALKNRLIFNSSSQRISP